MGGICCSDDMSYAMPGETCPEGTHPLPTAATGSDQASGPDQFPTHDNHAPDVTAPPHHDTDTDAPGVDFLGFGSNWYTFAMTYHFLSHWYSNVDHTSSVLVSTEVMSWTTVSVSATDKVHASQLFSSYTVTAFLPIVTQTQGHIETNAGTEPHTRTQTDAEGKTHVHSSTLAVETASPVNSGHAEESTAHASSPHIVEDAAHPSSVHSAHSASSAVPARKPSTTKSWEAGDYPNNHTVGTATRVPGPVPTAGAANIGGFGIAVAALALGMAAALM